MTIFRTDNGCASCRGELEATALGILIRAFKSNQAGVRRGSLVIPPAKSFVAMLLPGKTTEMSLDYKSNLDLEKCEEVVMTFETDRRQSHASRRLTVEVLVSVIERCSYY
jgi:hypothetical protein